MSTTATGNGSSKTVSGTTSAFSYDQAAALPLTLTDGTNTYVYGLGDTPLEQINGSTVTHLSIDLLGSVRLLTDSKLFVATLRTGVGKAIRSTGLAGTRVALGVNEGPTARP